MEYPSGRISDQLSRTVVIVACITLVIISLTFLSLTTSYITFLIAVTVFGSGFGLYSPASRALLSDIFQERRGQAFGLHLMGGDLSGVLAAGIAVIIVSIGSWQDAFLPLALILVPLLIAFYMLSRESIRINSVELKLRQTASRLFGDPSLRWLVFVYSLFVMASSGVISFLPTFLVEVYTFSFTFASTAFALVYAIGIVVKPVSGLLSDWAPRPLVAGGCLILGAGGLVVFVTASGKEVAILGVVGYALGQRGVPPALQAFLMDRFPEQSMGGDLGAVRTVYMTAGSLGPGITGLVASTSGFIPAFAFLAFFFLTGGVILIWFSVFGWPTPPKG